MNLDTPGGFADVDRADALADLEATPQQWREGRDLADVRLDLADIDAVVVTGMGGSGISGDVVLAVSDLAVPVVVSKGYDVPAFVGPRTLVVAASYSGGTEETLSSVEQALHRGARLFAVTSGGRLGEICDEGGHPSVRVPGGRQPRHSLGYLAVPALVALGLDGDLDETLDVLDGVSAACRRDVVTADNEAKQIAAGVSGGGVPLLWGGRGAPAVAAYRLKCQLNENAKMAAIHGEVPELDHNEVVAWQERGALTGSSGVVAFRDPAEHARIARRFDVTLALLGDSIAWQRDITAVGRSSLARLASMILVGDFVSVYAALALDRDPTPIPNIDRLKSELAE